ncbi:MAG: YabP/YqfC family sporulation protein [Lachnospiraceae bacterium]|nr:YabP/YqfC family sporulation protein [Lachnospiraceae bacterium]
MKKIEHLNISERFAETFSLPKDMIANQTLIHMIGGTDLYIENYKGIMLYSCQEIVIKGFCCKIIICGKGLSIAYYSDEDMKVSGRIYEVKIDRNDK